MRTITLKEMNLLNFKGVREKKIKFGGVTDIFGQNRTGKTTLFDAFLWLFFGKDSSGRGDFEIKTLDENNEAYHKLTHSVSALLNIDGDEITIRRELKEKWPTKKGTATETFTGHEQSFFWNEVPLLLNKFNEKVAQLIMDENMFKLLTNTSYFANLEWQKRRTVLEQLAGNISNEEVLSTIVGPGKAYANVMNALNAGKSLAEYRSEIAHKKKMIKDEKDMLPNRIDEAKRALPDFVDYDAIDKLLIDATREFESIDTVLNNKNLIAQQKQGDINKKHQQIQTLTTEGKQIEFGIQNHITDKRNQRTSEITYHKNLLSVKSQELTRCTTDIANAEARQRTLVEDQNRLRVKFTAIDGETLVFDDGEFSCPSCKQPLPANDIEAKKTELTNNFNSDKAKRLGEIRTKGQQLGTEISTIASTLVNLVTNKRNLENAIAELKNTILQHEQANETLSANEQEQCKDLLASNTRYIEIAALIEGLQNEVNVPIDAEDVTPLQNKKKDLQASINEYNKTLATKSMREKTLDRIKELENSEKELANALATQEGIEFEIMEFEKAKMDALETKVNSMFRIVKFKLFKTNINGGQEACCITLINGVPYADANYAAKIQAGLDIIQTLSEYNNIKAPIFIDNRESVLDIPELSTQVINLRVSEQDPTLRVVAA